MDEERWFSTERGDFPEPGQRVDWLQSDGEIVRGGKYDGSLWFLPGGMYVYYTPKFWRPAKSEAAKV